MAKVKCKGSIIKQTISMSLTTIAQVISIEHTGAESETFDSTALDSSAFRTKDPTGYAEPGEVNFEMFYDPALSGHQSFSDLVGAPADTVFSVTFADTGVTVHSFTASGFAFGYAIDMADGLKAQCKLTIDGDPAFPT